MQISQVELRLHCGYAKLVLRLGLGCDNWCTIVIASGLLVFIPKKINKMDQLIPAKSVV